RDEAPHGREYGRHEARGTGEDLDQLRPPGPGAFPPPDGKRNQAVNIISSPQGGEGDRRRRWRGWLRRTNLTGAPPPPSRRRWRRATSPFASRTREGTHD